MHNTIIINVPVPFIINETNLDTDKEKLKLHICDTNQLANASHGPRVKVLYNNNELFSVSPIHSDVAFIGSNKIKPKKLKAEEREIFKAVSKFATDNKDLIIEYQNFRNPPTILSAKEIENILKRNAKNIFNK